MQELGAFGIHPLLTCLRGMATEAGEVALPSVFHAGVQVPSVGQEGPGKWEVLSQSWSDGSGVGAEGGGLGRSGQVCNGPDWEDETLETDGCGDCGEGLGL